MPFFYEKQLYIDKNNIKKRVEKKSTKNKNHNKKKFDKAKKILR